MAKIEGLAHLGFFVDDLDRSLKFYTEVLGFTHDCSWEVPGIRVAVLKLGDCALEMMQHLEKHEFAAGRYDHLALRVDDIEAVWNDLKAKGVRFNTDEIIIDHGWGKHGARYILFPGPDGETIEIAQEMQP